MTTNGITSNPVTQVYIVLIAIIAILFLHDWIPVHSSFSLYWGVFLPLLATAFAVAIEIYMVGYGNSSIRQLFMKHDDQSTGYDTLFYLIHLLGIWNWFPLFVSLGLNGYSADFHNYVMGYSEYMGIGTGIFLVDLFLFMFIWTFFDYWNHRVLHLHPIWYMHRMHHSATNLTLFTATRNNPISFIVEPFIRVWPFFFLMPDVVVLSCFIALNHTYQIIVHSRLRSDWGWFGRWVLVSPAAHRVHHSCDPRHYGGNLAILTLWDRIFGTWIGADHGIIETGVKESGHNSGNLIRDIYFDIWIFLRQSARMLREFPFMCVDLAVNFLRRWG